MFRRIMLTALLAGGLAGFAAFGLQAWKVFPLILEAEVYEESTMAHGHPGVAHEHAVHDENAVRMTGEPASSEWEPENGVERLGHTLLADLLTGIGFASLLVGAIALSGREVGPREGVLWGLAGFAAFTVAPALGLPPELPGMMAADLGPRQAWWAATALATAAGIALVVFPKRPWVKAAGVALAVLPHAVGAPHGPVGGAVPSELVAHFAIASVVVAGLFWVLLGGLTGAVYHRLGRREAAVT